MIRMRGYREDGAPTIAFVLEPGNIRRMLSGDPLIVDIRMYLPEAMQAADPSPVVLIVHACDTQAEFQELSSTLSKQAVEAGARVIHVVPGSDELM